MAELVGILLAAGSGKRFGSDKLLQRLPDGDPIAVHACRNLLAALENVFIVVRPDSEVLADRLLAEGASVEVCADAEYGMGNSLAFAIKSNPLASGWVIGLADMPWISPASVDKVAEALRQGALIAAPNYQGKRGHPVGFSGGLYRELTALSGDVGAKSLLQSYQDRVCRVECDDPGILMDIDHPDDLQLSNQSQCL